MAVEEFQGMVLFHRKHREKDLLVKIFTDRFGKLMFFVRRPKTNPAFSLADLEAFSLGKFIADIQPSGLSFLRSTKQVQNMTNIYGDIYKQAYATYICNLADAALEDRHSHPAVFFLLSKAIKVIDQGMDAEIISHIVEIQMLEVFGVQQNWRSCVVCGQKAGQFDYSSKFHGILCPKHWYLDEYRYHASPKAIYFIRMFSNIDICQVSAIDLGHDSRQEIREVIDKIYDENVGIHLKSKSFIDRLEDFEKVDVDWSKRRKQESNQED